MNLFLRWKVSNAMSMDPRDLWATLPPALRRQIVDDIAAVLAEISREVRTGQANSPDAQGGRLHSPVDAPPGGEQSGKPAASVPPSASALTNSAGMRPTST